MDAVGFHQMPRDRRPSRATGNDFSRSNLPILWRDVQPSDVTHTVKAGTPSVLWILEI